MQLGEVKNLSNSWDGAFSASHYWLQRLTQNLAIDGAFCENSQKRKDVHYFCKNLFWTQGSEYAFELASKVKNISFLNQFKYQR